MSLSEFDKFQRSIGDLVVIESFLSTTTNYDVARIYAGEQREVLGIILLLKKK